MRSLKPQAAEAPGGTSPRLHHRLSRRWFVSGNYRKAAQKAETVAQRWDTRRVGNRRKSPQKQWVPASRAVSHDCDTSASTTFCIVLTVGFTLAAPTVGANRKRKGLLRSPEGAEIVRGNGSSC